MCQSRIKTALRIFPVCAPNIGAILTNRANKANLLARKLTIAPKKGIYAKKVD
jgi:hypothetical protein